MKVLFKHTNRDKFQMKGTNDDMALSLNTEYGGKTKLKDWWKIVRDNFQYLQTQFNTHQLATDLNHPAQSVKQKHLAENAVGTLQLVNKSVTSEKIASDAVGETELADGAVSADKIAKKTIGAEQIADKSIDAAQMVNYCITSGQLGQYCVTSTKIGPAAISGFHISDGCITKYKFNDELKNFFKRLETYLNDVFPNGATHLFDA